jgi:hypothetical protein
MFQNLQFFRICCFDPQKLFVKNFNMGMLILHSFMPAYTNYVMIPIMYETLKTPSVHYTFSCYNHLLTVCSK